MASQQVRKVRCEGCKAVNNFLIPTTPDGDLYLECGKCSKQVTPTTLVKDESNAKEAKMNAFDADEDFYDFYETVCQRKVLEKRKDHEIAEKEWFSKMSHSLRDVLHIVNNIEKGVGSKVQQSLNLGKSFAILVKSTGVKLNQFITFMGSKCANVSKDMLQLMISMGYHFARILGDRAFNKLYTIPSFPYLLLVHRVSRLLADAQHSDIDTVVHKMSNLLLSANGDNMALFSDVRDLVNKRGFELVRNSNGSFGILGAEGKWSETTLARARYAFNERFHFGTPNLRVCGVDVHPPAPEVGPPPPAPCFASFTPGKDSVHRQSAHPSPSVRQKYSAINLADPPPVPPAPPAPPTPPAPPAKSDPPAISAPPAISPLAISARGLTNGGPSPDQLVAPNVADAPVFFFCDSDCDVSDDTVDSDSDHNDSHGSTGGINSARRGSSSSPPHAKRPRCNLPPIENSSDLFKDRRCELHNQEREYPFRSKRVEYDWKLSEYSRLYCSPFRSIVAKHVFVIARNGYLSYHCQKGKLVVLGFNGLNTRVMRFRELDIDCKRSGNIPYHECFLSRKGGWKGRLILSDMFAAVGSEKRFERVYKTSKLKVHVI